MCMRCWKIIVLVVNVDACVLQTDLNMYICLLGPAVTDKYSSCPIQCTLSLMHGRLGTYTVVRRL